MCSLLGGLAGVTNASGWKAVLQDRSGFAKGGSGSTTYPAITARCLSGNEGGSGVVDEDDAAGVGVRRTGAK